MNGYDLSRKWFDWCFENPDKINTNHVALYFFCIEHCNRLGWKEKFGLPTTMAKEAIGIRSYNTYIKTLNELVEFGFIKMIEKSKNQYSSNIIALSNFDKALNKALDKALIKHTTKQVESTIQSTDSIDKQVTYKQITFNAKAFMCALGYDEKLVSEWFEVRKLKKLKNTETALNGFHKEVMNSKTNINEVLKTCVEKSWGGFKAEWLKNQSNEQKKEVSPILMK